MARPSPSSDASSLSRYLKGRFVRSSQHPQTGQPMSSGRQKLGLWERRRFPEHDRPFCLWLRGRGLEGPKGDQRLASPA